MSDTYTLACPGVSVELLTTGASVRSIRLSGSDGQTEDIVLGHETLAQYEVRPITMSRQRLCCLHDGITAANHVQTASLK